MNILGINDTITDSGISYYKNDRLILAINEERFTRKKGEGGFPEKCLNYFTKKYKSELKDIDVVIFAGIFTPTIITRIFPILLKVNKHKIKKIFFLSSLLNAFEYNSKINTSLSVENKIMTQLFVKLSEKSLRKRLPEDLKGKIICFTEHHLAHAAAAFYSSPFNSSLVVTFDGRGDGFSGNISIYKNNEHASLLKISASDSLGLFYSLVTVFLGYKEHRHEGKITGLAAYGDSQRVEEEFPFVFKKGGNLSYKGYYGKKGLKWLENHFSKYQPEDIAAWLQENTEDIICKIVTYFAEKTGEKNICLSGGVFANVKINQKINELKEIEKVYVYPAMGDAGISYGAICAELKKKKVLKSVFLGVDFTDKEIEKILKRRKISYKKVLKIEEKIAELLASGKIIARFTGKMEYGPRALGNRSILAPATCKKINGSLNKKLRRNDFMPFAPAIMSDFVDQCVEKEEKASLSSEFMTMSFRVKEFFKKKCPAVIHVDETSRIQKVVQKNNPDFYKILEKYHEITGIPAIINTSFNIHEEPIVMTPNQAIRSFLKMKLDYLAIGSFLIGKK